MIKINTLKNKLDLSTAQFRFFTGFSLLFLAGCLALLVPADQNLIILFGETLVHRPLNRPVWYERFVLRGIEGIILYCLFFFTVFYRNIFPNKDTLGKKSYALLIGFSVLVIVIIMFRANWTFGDDYVHIATTASNIYEPTVSYTGEGRFTMLGHKHYNMPLFFYRLLGFNTGLPVEAHFALIALFYALTVLCLYMLFGKIEPFDHCKNPVFSLFFTGTFLLLSRDFLRIFISLIYPETPVTLFFSVFLLMYYHAKKTDKKRYYIGAFLAAVYATYCKEPVFGAFLIIALTNYIFNFKNISKREGVFYAALIANGIAYITLYYFMSFRKATVFYYSYYREGMMSAIQILQLIIAIYIKNPVLILMFLFGFIRLFYVVIQKERKSIYYDSLLFAGIGYACAFMLLHLSKAYYFVPAIILFLPSLVYWTKYLYQSRKRYAFCLFGFLMIVYMINATASVSTMTDILKARREFIPDIDALLLEHNNGKEFIWYESDNVVTGDTFYIVSRNWKKDIMNVSLNYRNKSWGKNFFAVKNDTVDMHKDIFFFYPKDNDQRQPVPDSLVKLLADNHFELYKDSYDLLIYRR